MPSPTYILITLAAMGIVTVALRWIPFAFVHALRDSAFFGFLGRVMPVGVMVALVVYALFARMDLLGGGASGADPGGLWAAPLALVVTIGLHLWRRNSLLSIFAGTALYMVLVNFVA